MTMQKEMIQKIKETIEEKIKKHNEQEQEKRFYKEIKVFTVGDVGDTGIKEIRYKTNFTNGNVFTEYGGQIFVGKKGGLKGKVRTFGQVLKVRGKNDIYKIELYV